MTYLADILPNAVATLAGSAVAGVVAWIVARTRRKVSLKVDKTIAVGNTTEEVRQLFAIAAEHAKKSA